MGPEDYEDDRCLEDIWTDEHSGEVYDWNTDPLGLSPYDTSDPDMRESIDSLYEYYENHD